MIQAWAPASVPSAVATSGASGGPQAHHPPQHTTTTCYDLSSVINYNGLSPAQLAFKPTTLVNPTPPIVSINPHHVHQNNNQQQNRPYNSGGKKNYNKSNSSNNHRMNQNQQHQNQNQQQNNYHVMGSNQHVMHHPLNQPQVVVAVPLVPGQSSSGGILTSPPDDSSYGQSVYGHFICNNGLTTGPSPVHHATHHNSYKYSSPPSIGSSGGSSSASVSSEKGSHHSNHHHNQHQMRSPPSQMVVTSSSSSSLSSNTILSPVVQTTGPFVPLSSSSVSSATGPPVVVSTNPHPAMVHYHQLSQPPFPCGSTPVPRSFPPATVVYAPSDHCLQGVQVTSDNQMTVPSAGTTSIIVASNGGNPAAASAISPQPLITGAPSLVPVANVPQVPTNFPHVVHNHGAPQVNFQQQSLHTPKKHRNQQRNQNQQQQNQNSVHQHINQNMIHAPPFVPSAAAAVLEFVPTSSGSRSSSLVTASSLVSNASTPDGNPPNSKIPNEPVVTESKVDAASPPVEKSTITPSSPIKNGTNDNLSDPRMTPVVQRQHSSSDAGTSYSATAAQTANRSSVRTKVNDSRSTDDRHHHPNDRTRGNRAGRGERGVDRRTRDLDNMSTCSGTSGRSDTHQQQHYSNPSHGHQPSNANSTKSSSGGHNNHNRSHNKDNHHRNDNYHNSGSGGNRSNRSGRDGQKSTHHLDEHKVKSFDLESSAFPPLPTSSSVPDADSLNHGEPTNSRLSIVDDNRFEDDQHKHLEQELHHAEHDDQQHPTGGCLADVVKGLTGAKRSGSFSNRMMTKTNNDDPVVRSSGCQESVATSPAAISQNKPSDKKNPDATTLPKIVSSPASTLFRVAFQDSGTSSQNSKKSVVRTESKSGSNDSKTPELISAKSSSSSHPPVVQSSTLSPESKSSEEKTLSSPPASSSSSSLSTSSRITPKTNTKRDAPSSDVTSSSIENQTRQVEFEPSDDPLDPVADDENAADVNPESSCDSNLVNGSSPGMDSNSSIPKMSFAAVARLAKEKSKNGASASHDHNPQSSSRGSSSTSTSLKSSLVGKSSSPKDHNNASSHVTSSNLHHLNNTNHNSSSPQGNLVTLHNHNNPVGHKLNCGQNNNSSDNKNSSSSSEYIFRTSPMT